MYFEKNMPIINFNDSKVKPPLKLKLLEKVIVKGEKFDFIIFLIFKYEEYGFNYNTNKDRSDQASANKVIDNIFIDGLYKYSDYSWIVQKEQKWFFFLKKISYLLKLN